MIKYLDEFKGMPLPRYQTSGSASIDLMAAVSARIEPGKHGLVRTGLTLRLPENTCGLVLSRSGIALHHGVIVMNAPGLIDSDYTGEIKVILCNTGRGIFYINPGDRIAQLLIIDHKRLPGVAVSTAVRHDGGFGSTGRRTELEISGAMEARDERVKEWERQLEVIREEMENEETARARRWAKHLEIGMELMQADSEYLKKLAMKGESE